MAEQNENVTKNQVALEPELIQDESLIKNGDRAFFKAFKNWSWNLAWHNKYAGIFLVISLIAGVIGFVASFLDAGLSNFIGMEEGYSLNIFQTIVDFVLGVGLLGFSFNIAKGLKQKFDDFFHEITWDRVSKIFVGGLLYGLAVFGGFILLLIPGIIFSVRFQFFAYAVVDKGLGPVEALKYSWRVTKGRFWEIIGFDCYFVLINLLGLLCLIIGLIRTTAMTGMASARYYRLISNIYDKNLQLRDTSQQKKDS